MHYAAVVARRIVQRLRGDFPQARSSHVIRTALILLSCIRVPLQRSLTELLGGSPRRFIAPARRARFQARPLTEVPATRSNLTAELLARRIRLPRIERTERLIPAGVAALLFAAAIVSSLPAVAPNVAVGGVKPSGAGRVTVRLPGADANAVAGGIDAGASLDPSVVAGVDPTGEVAGVTASADPSGATGDTIGGTYLENGTVVNQLGAAQVADSKKLLKVYTVQSGDTLSGIAAKFGLDTMTVWWANKSEIPDLAALHLGQTLIIPPVDGLVVTVGENDTLESLASKYGVSTQEIVDENNLPSPILVVGQTLILPGAVGAAAPTPKPTPTPAPVKTATKTTTRTGSGGGTTSTKSLPGSGGSYSGGRFAWPVIGGGNYISQYSSGGHPAIDIAAQYGTPVVAAAAGRIIWAGWKTSGGGMGGGIEVWISHGGGLYTTYNHMSAEFVGAGQSVGRGQRIGSIGATGWATGPHLHFEVWVGYPWNGGYRVNPLAYLR